MISIQLPQFSPHQHPFNNPYPSQSYVMPDHAVPGTTGSGMQRVAPTTTNLVSSPVDLKLKQLQQQSNSKRRPSRAGTRSVSTLTTAQLERKRANDREAQRAIRQRTKDHIEALERRIAEITSNNDHAAKMVQIMEQNDELELENAALRSKLNQAVTAMSESGVSAEVIAMITNPTSPTRKIPTNPTPLHTAALPPSGVRSLPNSAIQAHPPPQEWTPVYTPVVAHAHTHAHAQRSPSVNDVSPIAPPGRWGPAHGAVSPPLTEPDRSMMHPSMEQQPQSLAPQHMMEQPLPGPPPQSGSYYAGNVHHVDSAGRPFTYAPQQQPTPVVRYAQAPSPVPSVSLSVSDGYHHHQQQQQQQQQQQHQTQQQHTRQSVGPQMTPSPAFAQFPHQSEYLPTSPHNVEGVQVMQAPPHHMMYLPPGMKPEQ